MADLEKIARDTSYGMQQDRAKYAGDKERQKIIGDAKDKVLRHFYCNQCHSEVQLRARLCVVRDAFVTPIATHRARCPKCRTMLIRRITDANTDPYWFASSKVRRTRAAMRVDMLQMDEHGFETNFPDAVRKAVQEGNEAEEKIRTDHYDPSGRTFVSREMKRALRHLDPRS